MPFLFGEQAVNTRSALVGSDLHTQLLHIHSLLEYPMTFPNLSTTRYCPNTIILISRIVCQILPGNISTNIESILFPVFFIPGSYPEKRDNRVPVSGETIQLSIYVKSVHGWSHVYLYIKPIPLGLGGYNSLSLSNF